MLKAVGPVRAVPLILAVGSVLTGCADSRGGPIPYNVSDFGVPDSPELAPLEAGYKIAPMDNLTVKVFKMPDLSGDYEVDLAGNISMPLIGELRAFDLTTAQLDESLTHKLGEKYLENPDVSVGIKSSTRRSVTVDGAAELVQRLDLRQRDLSACEDVDELASDGSGFIPLPSL